MCACGCAGCSKCKEPWKGPGNLLLDPHETVFCLHTEEETWPPLGVSSAAYQKAGAGWGDALEVSLCSMVVGMPGQRGRSQCDMVFRM